MSRAGSRDWWAQFLEAVGRGEVREGQPHTVRVFSVGEPPARFSVRRPVDAADAEDWLYDRAEEACAAGLSLERALQCVRDGYSSVAADEAFRADP